MRERGAGALIKVGFLAEVVVEGSQGVGKGRRERRQDKRTGTLRVRFVVGAGKFPGPEICSRALPVRSAWKLNRLLGTLGLGGRHGG